jgi:hypothetical protein
MVKKAATPRCRHDTISRIQTLGLSAGPWACSRSAKNRTLVPRDKPPAVTRYANVTWAAAGRCGGAAVDTFTIASNCEKTVHSESVSRAIDAGSNEMSSLTSRSVSVHVALMSSAFGMARGLFHVR